MFDEAGFKITLSSSRHQIHRRQKAITQSYSQEHFQPTIGTKIIIFSLNMETIFLYKKVQSSIILACVAGGSGCARETFCGKAANSLAGLAREGIFASGPILLTTCAAFCTRVRDQSSRGHPLPPATQASNIRVFQMGNLSFNTMKNLNKLKVNDRRC